MPPSNDAMDHNAALFLLLLFVAVFNAPFGRMIRIILYRKLIQ